MKPKKPQIKRKAIGALTNYIPGVGHTWECEECGAKEMYLSRSRYDTKGIVRLASNHKCGEEKEERADFR